MMKSSDNIWKYLYRIVIIAGVYFLIARICQWFIIPDSSGIATIWFPSGIFISAILLTRNKLRLYLVIALLIVDFISEILSGNSFNLSLIYALIHSADAVFSVWLLFRFSPKPILFDNLKQVSLYILFSVLMSNLLMSILAASATNFMTESGFWTSFKAWSLSNGIGNLMLTPFIISSYYFFKNGFKYINRQKLSEFILLIIIFLAANYLFFNNYKGEFFSQILIFLNLPFLIWAAIRFNVAGSASLLFLLTIIVGQNFLTGKIMVPDFISESGSILGMYMYLGIQGISVLYFAVMVSERNKSIEAELILTSKLNGLINNKDVSVWSVDTHYNYVSFNNFFSNVYLKAYNVKLEKGMNAIDILPSEIKELWKSKYDAALAGQKNTFEFSERIENQEYHYEVSLNPIINNNNVTEVSAISIDISGRKRGQEILIKTGEKYLNLLEFAPDAFFQGDAQGNFILVNNKAIELTGFSKEELLAMNMVDLFAKDVIDEKPLNYGLLKLGDSIKTEREIKRKSGDRIVVEMNSKLMPDTTYECFMRDISERKKAEEIIYQSEARLNRAELASKSGNWELHMDSKKVIASAGAFKIYGVAQGQLTFSIIKDIPLPEYRNKLDIALKNLIEENIPYNLEFKIKTFDTGEIKDIHSIAEFDPGKRILFGIIKDISEQKLAEKTLNKERNLMKALLENVPDHIYFKDINSRFIVMSKSQAQRFGLKDPSFAIGRSDFDFFTEEHARQAFEDEQMIIKTGNSITNVEEKETWQDGTESWVSTTKMPLKDEKGNIIGTFGISSIITERKIAERELIIAKERAEEGERNLIVKNDEYEAVNEELKQANLELSKAIEKSNESDYLKTAFLQNMSHEIRTPMNAINGFSGLLDKEGLSLDKRKSYTSIIQNSVKQLLSIVNNILTISSLETKQEKVNIQSVCINTIIIELLTIFKSQAINQNISLFAKQNLNDRQSVIYTDSTKVTQVLTNLISNALKFTHEGFVEFGYFLVENNELVPQDEDLTLQFYVKDSGIGIVPEMREKIFERFRQADLSISKKYGGTGLGLAISKSFIELLGGNIWVESAVGSGSTFYFTLPYHPVHDNVIPHIPERQELNQLTIVVAEDEEYNFLLIEEILIHFNLILIHAKDGQEAIDICRKNQGINLILMDIKMAGMDGNEAAKLIKEFRPDLPIIAQTAYALAHEIEKYSGNFFDDYITKPINEEELKQKMGKFIKL